MSEVRYQDPLSKTFLNACPDQGLSHNDVFNCWARPQEGYGRCQVTQKEGTRCSSASGFLELVLSRKNFESRIIDHRA